MKTSTQILASLNLLGPPRRVLVVEDYVEWLLTLKLILEGLGHSVIPMIGVLDVDAQRIEGLTVAGKLFEPSPKTAEIEAVFLDYNFAGGKHNGATFLRDFRQHSAAPVLGMSSDRALNSLLESLGATESMQKSRLRAAFREG